MKDNSKSKGIIKVLLNHYGQTFCEELDIPIEKNTLSPLFQLLCASLLFSARISADIAVNTMRALVNKGWTTAEKMEKTRWRQRVRVINKAGYARYDGITSEMIGETTELLLEKYKGDLRRLREAAGYDPAIERELLKEFKGIGDTGVDIFFREVQVAWDEIFPFMDNRAKKAARELGLPDDSESLLDLVYKRDFPRLVATLVRIEVGSKENINKIFQETERIS